MLALMATSDYGVDHADMRVSAPQYSPGHDAKQDQAALARAFAPRKDLFLDGDKATHLFEVVSGIVCAYRLLPDGERHIISFYFPGDMLGSCTLETHTYSAQALTPVQVRAIPRAAMERDLQQRPELAHSLLHLATRELNATRDHLLCLAAKSADARMASFLLALSRRNALTGEDPRRIQLPMTRLDIADYLGLTIETVSRTMSKFKRKGLIDLPRATQVVIKDLAGLSALVDA